MKTALVWSGGGARGAYELGVWKALEKLNIKCDIVTGASIGSMNGIMYVQNDIKTAEKIWNDINLKYLFSEAIEYQTEKELLKKYLNHAKQGGLEPDNLKQNLIKYLDLDKIYTSDIDYGLTTVKYPNFKLVEISKKEIEKEKLIDYIIASSTVYPVFKLKEIENNKYVDGGYRNSIPLNLAKKLGVNKYIIVNISMVARKYKPPKNEDIIYITPKNKLGAPLTFNKEASKRNILYGYNDTMKVFGKLEGNKYTFKKFDKQYQKDNIFKTKKSFINTLEFLAKSFNLDDTKIYTINKLNNILTREILKNEDIKDKKLKNLKSKKERIIYIYYNLKNQNKKKIIKEAINKFNKEYKAAYYLSKNM